MGKWQGKKSEKACVKQSGIYLTFSRNSFIQPERQKEIKPKNPKQAEHHGHGQAFLQTNDHHQLFKRKEEKRFIQGLKHGHVVLIQGNARKQNNGSNQWS